MGWTRAGIEEKAASGIAVLMSNGEAGVKVMEMGEANAGRQMKDVIGGRTEEITLDEKGSAEFYCNAGSVSVWTLLS